jgi:hypothetical protein
MAPRISGSASSARLWQLASRLLLGLSLLALIAFIVWSFARDPVDMLSYCGRLIPGERSSSFTIERTADGVPIISADISIAQDTKDAAILEKLIECVRKSEPVVVQDVLAPSEPLGQIANRWNRDGPISLRLDGSDKNQALRLNNLRMSQKYVASSNAASTARAHASIVSAWCKENAACLSCDPTSPSAGDKEITVRLTPGAPLVEATYPGGPWTPRSDGSFEPWQYVKPDGSRYVFECKRSG